MTGEYQEYTDEQTGELYHSCVIYDALACCQQGVEFVLTDGDYPEEGTTITVVGRYETYTTPYYDYFHLVDTQSVGVCLTQLAFVSDRKF